MGRQIVWGDSYDIYASSGRNIVWGEVLLSGAYSLSLRVLTLPYQRAIG